jgi:predicted DNA-binding protein (MmcQ/YjbR family)
VRLQELVEHCLAKPGAEETPPWGEAELVAKVGGKAFAFIGPDAGTVGVTCGRDVAEVLELVDASYDAVVAALPKSRRPVGRADAAAAGPSPPRPAQTYLPACGSLGGRGGSHSRQKSGTRVDGCPFTHQIPRGSCRLPGRGVCTWRGVSRRGTVVNTRSHDLRRCRPTDRWSVGETSGY